MDEKKFSEKQRKVLGTNKVEPIQVNHIDRQYELILNSDTPATSTALVTIARLVPRNTQLPAFNMRWDHNKEELDIDIYIGTEIRKDLWKENGYEGHKTTLINPGEYSVNIIMPANRTVFNGIVSVGLLVGLNVSDNISLSEHVAIEITEPSSSL